MSEEKKPGGRRRADVVPDSPSTVEIPVIKRRAEAPASEAPAPEAPAAEAPSAEVPPIVAASSVPAAKTPRTSTSRVAKARRINPLLVLAGVLPLATLGALALVQPPADETTSSAPSATTLTQSTVLCPVADDATTWVGVASPDVSGELSGSGSVTLKAGAVVSATAPVITGEGALAPGLAAISTAPNQALTCSTPQFEQWFGGLGASAVHQSRLTLTNPDAGTAVADVTVYGKRGELADAQDLRGVSIPGGKTVSIDLAERIPVADDLAVHVGVTRGRVGVQAFDQHQPIGTSTAAGDWRTPQRAPAKEVRLLGLGAGTGTRTLTLLNPSQNEARVSLQLITDESEIAPTELKPLTLEPGEVQSIDLSKVIGDPPTTKTRGVRVSGTEAVVAGLNSVVGTELISAVPTVGLDKLAGLPVPGGSQRLVLAGARNSGQVTVTTRAADGTALSEDTVEIAPGRSLAHPLDAKARWVTVEPGKTGAGGAITLGAKGHSVLALWPLVTEELAPAVDAALG